MKKLFISVIMLVMVSFAGNNLFAQNEELVTDEQLQLIDTSLVPEQAIATEPEDASVEESSEPATQVLTMNDLQSVVALLNNTVGDNKQNKLGTEPSVAVPFHKHRKINGHHVCQRLELSIMGDKSESSMDLANKLFGGALAVAGKIGGDADENFAEKMESKTGGLGLGANFGYSLVFIPGYREDGAAELELNRFGFGYSVGLISQFDHEKNAGLSWDFLGKVGIETGFNKAIGVGIDLLFGGGKTTQTVVDFGDVNFEDPDPNDLDISSESLWCAKAGTQLWLRLNFLTKSINNFDTALFSRFVYSFRPYSENEMLERMMDDDECPVWQYEAWSFGFTMTYFF